MTLYRKIAHLLLAIQNCEASGNTEWKARHADALRALVSNHMPSGSGIDNGTALDFHASTPERLVFDAPYHHMSEHGSYDGWTDYRVIVKPSLAFGLLLRITGRDRNEVKEYLHQTFVEYLEREITD